ncbi:MAG: T9SS type A sorting domain-containing protein [Chlorobi bacterium]|jgi:hypothetical protein|nr:T9SS type A sorting domain-containing protein [Chlorobiota bacterium]
METTKVLASVLVLIATVVYAQGENSFTPNQALSFAKASAMSESGDTSVVLVSIEWMLNRPDGLASGNFDTSSTGAMPVWEYTFLSPEQNQLLSYVVTSTGSSFQIAGRRQRMQDTARPINQSWYDIDSVVGMMRASVVVGQRKSQCPELQTARIRLVMVREPYVYRRYIPMWVMEHWCIPQRFKLVCLYDAVGRSITICQDSVALTATVHEDNALDNRDSPSRNVIAVHNTIHLTSPLPAESIVKIFDLSGRIISSTSLSAGTTTIPIEQRLPCGVYRMVIVSAADGKLRDSFLIMHIE